MAKKPQMEEVLGSPESMPSKEKYLKDQVKKEPENREPEKKEPEILMDPEKHQENEPEKQPEPEKTGFDWESDDNPYKKRYRDFQSFHDQKFSKYDRMVRENPDAFAENPDGSLSIRQREVTKTVYEAPPQRPTQAEYDDDFDKAQQKFEKYLEWKHEKKMQEKEEKVERERRNREYNRALQETSAQVDRFYPDAKNPESELFRRANEIFLKDPTIKESPYHELYVFDRAAVELGISRNVGENGAKKKPAPKKQEKSVIVPGSGGNANQPDHSKPTMEEIMSMSGGDQRIFMKKNYLKQYKT